MEHEAVKPRVWKFTFYWVGKNKHVDVYGNNTTKKMTFDRFEEVFAKAIKDFNPDFISVETSIYYKIKKERENVGKNNIKHIQRTRRKTTKR